MTPVLVIIWILVGIITVYGIISYGIRHRRFHKITLAGVLAAVFFTVVWPIALLMFIFVEGNELVVWERKS